MKFKDISTCDKISSCDGCGVKFKDSDDIIVIREWNTVLHNRKSCIESFRISNNLPKIVYINSPCEDTKLTLTLNLNHCYVKEISDELTTWYESHKIKMDGFNIEVNEI